MIYPIINSLIELTFQPHPMYLAQLAYQASPTINTLQRWAPILKATADYMASYAWKNETSGHYDLGPPSVLIFLVNLVADKACRAYGVTENTPPAESLNLAYEVSPLIKAIIFHVSSPRLACLLEVRPRCGL